MSDEFVSHSGHCFDSGLAGGDFLTQLGNVDIYGAGLTIEIEAPGFFEQLFAGEGLAGPTGEQVQQFEFVGRKFDPGCR